MSDLRGLRRRARHDGVRDRACRRFSWLLSRWARAEDVVLGMPVSGRDHPGGAGTDRAVRQHRRAACGLRRQTGLRRRSSTAPASEVLEPLAHQEVPFEQGRRGRAPRPATSAATRSSRSASTRSPPSRRTSSRSASWPARRSGFDPQHDQVRHRAAGRRARQRRRARPGLRVLLRPVRRTPRSRLWPTSCSPCCAAALAAPERAASGLYRRLRSAAASAGGGGQRHRGTDPRRLPTRRHRRPGALEPRTPSRSPTRNVR